MEKLLKFIIEKIVENPDEVKIERTEEEGFVNLALTVNPEDI